MPAPSIAEAVLLADRLETSHQVRQMGREQMRGTQMQNALLGMHMGDYPNQKNQQQEDLERKKDEFARKWLSDTIDYVTPENYSAYRETAIRKGVPQVFFPSPEKMQSPESFQMWHPKFRDHIMKIAEKEAGAKPAVVKTWMRGKETMNLPEDTMPPEGFVPYKNESEKITELSRLIAERDTLSQGDPNRNIYDAKIQKEISSKGMVIESDGKGGFTIRTNADQTVPAVTKKTQGEIEGKIISGKEQIARMTAIYNEFKPEYQEIGTRLKASWTGFKAKLGKDVPKEDASKLIEYKKFTRKAIENINLYIKELTGAQMSEKEADRLRLAQPDPGENWYQGDDPITFKAKMDDVLKMSRAAVARYEYYRSKGLSDNEIKGIINSDAAITLETIASGMR